jgi:hypothetical protein
METRQLLFEQNEVTRIIRIIAFVMAGLNAVFWGFPILLRVDIQMALPLRVFWVVVIWGAAFLSSYFSLHLALLLVFLIRDIIYCVIRFLGRCLVAFGLFMSNPQKSEIKNRDPMDVFSNILRDKPILKNPITWFSWAMIYLLFIATIVLSESDPLRGGKVVASDFFRLSHIIIFGVVTWFSYLAWSKCQGMAVLSGLFALLFNPFFLVCSQKNTWLLLYLVTALFFIGYWMILTGAWKHLKSTPKRD